MLRDMGSGSRPGDIAHGDDAESAAAERRRLAWEAEKIAEADARMAAGRLIGAAEIDAWIDRIGSGHELPPLHRKR